MLVGLEEAFCAGFADQTTSVIARWSSMLDGVSEAREEITMTACRSGMTVISCPYMPDAL
jgi:hypothetical protein